MQLRNSYMYKKAYVERMYTNHIGHAATLVSTRQLADDLFLDIVQAAPPPDKTAAYLRVHDGDGIYLFQALARS